MTIEFTQNNDHKCGFPIISTKTDDNVDLEFLMYKGEVAEIYIDGYESSSTADYNNGVYVRVGDEFKTLRYMCLQAQEYFDN